MVDKAKDTIYHRHYVLGKELPKGFVNEGQCWIINSTKDLTVHNGVDVSICTSPMEETMQRHWIMETTD